MTSETAETEEASDEQAAREGEDERYLDVDTSHLDDVDDGCGCAEVWEYTSGQRAAEGDAGAD